ncbi:MAG: hypothetical protein ABIJ09_24625 [Pseudomonadota bacterium]
MTQASRIACGLVALAALAACATAPRTESVADPAPVCNFESGLRAVEAAPVELRVTPALAALAQACPGVLGNLAQAADQARQLPRAERARILGEAASQALPPACATTSPGAPASSVSWGCPPPEPMRLEAQLLADLDAGTYLFAIAVRSRLAGAQQLSTYSVKLIDNLILAAALEGEAARTGVRTTPPL